MRHKMFLKPAIVLCLAVILLFSGTGSVLASKVDTFYMNNFQRELVFNFTRGNSFIDAFSFPADFYSVPGSAFISVEKSQGWAYDYMGCIHNTTDGLSLMNFNLQIPDGSRIVLLRVYYDDTLVSTDGSAWITRYPEGGTTFQDLVNVPTSGSAGHGSNYANLDYVVDTYSNSYVLNWRANATGIGMQLCGMRVMYYVPYTNAFIPVISKK